MNMFKREKGSTVPTVPPRPSKDDLDNPVTHGQNTPQAGTTSQQRSGMMGVMQKVNPFKSASQGPSADSRSSSSESLERAVATTEQSQNPGVLKGVMQKVNPFKSSSQISQAVSSESLEGGSASDANQNPGKLKGVIQKVNPFKSSSQVPKNDAPAETAELPEREGKWNPTMITGVMHKVNPFKSSQPKDERLLHSDLSASQGSLSDNNNMAEKQLSEAVSSESLEGGGASDANQNPGMLKGMMQKVNPFKSSSQMPKNDPRAETADLPEKEGKWNPAMITGVMQKVNPFKSSQPKEERPLHSDLSSSQGSLSDNNNMVEKQRPGMLQGMMQKVNPFRSYTQMPEEECETDSALSSLKTQDNQSLNSQLSSSSESLEDSNIERGTIWYTDMDADCETKSQPKEQPKKKTMTFRIKRILPSALFGAGTKESTGNASTQESVEVQTLELADIPEPGDGTALDPLEDDEGLLAWWQTVEGWDEWNEANQDDEAETVVEEAADRVFMAARLFVRFFNQRGASLQQRILELLSLADAADTFHKKTVTASMGGGVASVAGSVTTITGLILAPFTAGTSLIVTAVGIGVATAGGLASASANITDTMHSKTDRKKVEKMIQDYQEEMRDIKECLEFVQEGMETLEDWNFEQYAESISKKHLNQNVKHVMKEGGRAGKALVINTESLISTVQVLSVAGGAAKAAQVMSITTGVMSGLFLALDIFFLAKDSMELKKGAKTEFASKIREVCKDLQDGLLELNRIKEQLQKTMDGIEVEVEEEEDEELLKADLKKLVDLEE